MLLGEVKNLVESRISLEEAATTAASQREVVTLRLSHPHAICLGEAIWRESREERLLRQRFGPNEATETAGRSQIVRFPLCVLLEKEFD